jgi:hypothetical protein
MLVAAACGVLAVGASPALALSLREPLKVAVLVHADSALGMAVVSTSQTAVVSREAATANLYTRQGAKFSGLFGSQINLNVSQQKQPIDGVVYSPVKLPAGTQLSDLRVLQEHAGLRDPVTGKYGTYLEVGAKVHIGDSALRQTVVRQYQDRVRKAAQYAQRQQMAGRVLGSSLSRQRVLGSSLSGQSTGKPSTTSTTTAHGTPVVGYSITHPPHSGQTTGTNGSKVGYSITHPPHSGQTTRPTTSTSARPAGKPTTTSTAATKKK